MKNKYLILICAALLSAAISGCDSDKSDEGHTAKSPASQGSTNTELLSDEELQKRIQDKR